MKKLFLVGAIALFGAVNAQTTGGFKLGAHVGLPVGDAAEGLDFNAGVDVAYTWRVAPNFDLGITSGYSHYFVEDVEIPAIVIGGQVVIPAQSYSTGGGIIPLAATAQYSFNEKFFLGADLGYAFYTGEDAEGGDFYYQPKVGYSLNAKNDLYLGYKGISSDGATLSSINLGYAYKF